MHNNNDDDVILHIIVIISVICTVLYNNIRCLLTSKTLSNAIPRQEQQGTGLKSTTGTKTSTTKTRSQSRSTTPGNAMVDQKKVVGGMKKANRSRRTLSSTRSKRSKEPLNSQKNMTTLINHQSQTVEDSLLST